MTIKEVLNIKEHRPWEMPADSWKFYQEWNNAIFLHWKVPKEELQKLVPKELELDFFDGDPWVSLVAFDMERIRPKNLPAFTIISNFHEINIRTYVKLKGKQGVYFLSIEAAKKISCFVARKLSELPYRYSSMNRTHNSFHSSNKEKKESFQIKFRLLEPTQNKSDLDLWLSERYALFQDGENSINEFQIHHIEWPLNKIEIENLELEYNRFYNLFNGSPDLSHYSKGVQVISWGVKRHRKLAIT